MIGKFHVSFCMAGVANFQLYLTISSNLFLFFFLNHPTKTLLEHLEHPALIYFFQGYWCPFFPPVFQDDYLTCTIILWAVRLHFFFFYGTLLWKKKRSLLLSASLLSDLYLSSVTPYKYRYCFVAYCLHVKPKYEAILNLN